jgi:hypothetical protein
MSELLVMKFSRAHRYKTPFDWSTVATMLARTESCPDEPPVLSQVASTICQMPLAAAKKASALMDNILRTGSDATGSSTEEVLVRDHEYKGE